MKNLPGAPRKDRNKTPARRTESRSPQLPGLRMGLLLFLFLAAAVVVLAPIAAQGSGSVSVSATRNDDGVSADVSWTAYDGDDFSYYRVIVCDDSQYDGASCSGSVYTGDAIYDAGATGPVTATGLDPHAGYGVILQVWRSDESQVIKVHATIPALPQPTPTPTPMPEPTATPTPEPAEEPTPTPTPEPTPAPEPAEEPTPTPTPTPTPDKEEDQSQAGLAFGNATVANQSYTKDTAIATLTLPEATGGRGTIAYSLSPSLPAGLSFDAANRAITGTPTVTSAQAAYRYQATDGTDNTAVLSFKLEVAETFQKNNSVALVWISTQSDLVFTRGTAVNHSLPGLKRSDNDEAYPYVSYYLSSNRGIPDGLSLSDSGGAAKITGTPTGFLPETTFAYGGNPQQLEFNAPRDQNFMITVNGTPKKPNAPTVTRGSSETSLNVSWTAPSAQPAITGYGVEYREKGDTDWTSHSNILTTTSTTIGGLEYGTEYEVRVWGINSLGAGDKSNATSAYTEGFRVSWTMSNNKTELNESDAATTLTVSIPNNGWTYDPAVNITVSVGDSADSATEGTDYATIADFTLTPNSKLSHSVTITPTDDALYEKDETISVSASVTGYSVSNLDGITLKSADTWVGPTVTAKLSNTVPHDAIDVSWTNHASNGTASDYDVQYREKGKTGWTEHTHDGTTTNARIASLKYKGTFEVRVKGKNADAPDSEAPWSSVGRGRPPPLLDGPEKRQRQRVHHRPQARRGCVVGHRRFK